MEENRTLESVLEESEKENTKTQDIEKEESSSLLDSLDDIEETEKETKEQTKEEIKDNSKTKKNSNLTDLDKYEDDEPIGDLGLTKNDLKKDQTTPAEAMSNLKKFADELDVKTEAIVGELKKEKEAKAVKEKIDKIRNEEKKIVVNEKTESYKDTRDVSSEVKDSTKELLESDIFDNSKEIEEKHDNIAVPQEVEKPKEEKKVVDISSVRIKKIDAEEKINLFNELLVKRKNRKKTTRVPLINSGYIADMGPLSSPEIRDLSGALRSKDQFGYWEYLYKIIHEKMVSTSIGQMDFETFLKSTSLQELEILLYGLFASTYPEKNSFPTQCVNPNCKMKFNFSYNNSDYMIFDDMDENGNSPTKDLMRKLVAAQAIDATKFFKSSKTNTLVRTYLEDSGLLVDIRHPTLYNQLYDVIKQMIEEELQDASEVTINRMPYIERVLVPLDSDDPETEYAEYEGLQEKIVFLSDLSDKDDLKLEEEISNNVLSLSHISFKMHDVSCPICKKKIPDEYVDFRSLLFMIHRIHSVKKK